VADGAKLTSHDRPDRVLIAFNTLVDNKTNIFQGARKEGMGATFITVAYNIIRGGGAAASISGPYSEGVWKGNIIYKTNGAGNMPANGFREVDPLLARNAKGTFHLLPGSPAIDRVWDNYPSVATDMDGQEREAPLDAGADEVSIDKVKAYILSPNNVGTIIIRP
jgi:poly(beta-D-mannuronate) lyase